MGEIIFSRFTGNKVIYGILLEENESLALQGRIWGIHVLCLDMCKTESRIIEKGKNGVTRYFSIPIKYKPRSKHKPLLESSQIIDTKTKAIYIFICDRLHVSKVEILDLKRSKSDLKTRGLVGISPKFPFQFCYC